MSIGEKVKEARLAAGLTQQQLATAAGITIPTLSNIEKDRAIVFSSLQQVLEVLHLSLDLVETEHKAG